MVSTSQINTQMDSFRLSTILASAVYEWLLMFLLFVNALFSYLVTIFARLFKLQTPCLLCSRLDHVFGNEKPGFYKDLICDAHKSEISSLVHCRVHQKLADANHICEGCLLPFVSDKSSLESSGVHKEICSCCSVPLRMSSLVQINPFGVSEGKDLSYRSLKLEPDTEIIPDNLSTSLLDDTEVEKSVHPTIEFDSSLSLPADNRLVGHEIEEVRNINPPTLLKAETQDHPATEFESSLSLPADNHRVHDEAARNINPPALIETTTVDHPVTDFDSSLSFPVDNHLDESHDVPPVTVGHEIEEAEDINPPTLFATTTKQLSSEFSNGKCKLFSTTSIGDKSKPLHSTETNPMDLNDAYKLAISSKTPLPSPTVAEVVTGRDSSKAYVDLKLLISQFSASRGLESPWNDLSPSPRVYCQGDEFRFTDASSSAILHNITTSLSIERNESGFESLDGGSVLSEIEGESALDRLKRQVELDRKSIYLLYKELEDERSASAIAANQAMAMINKLQEEKAMMQMEALHYQRMMEEQAEYDQEALRRANELLSQREEEMQSLKMKLEATGSSR